MPQESLRTRKKRTIDIIRILKKEYPDSRCSLIFESSFQLLVATILSAQCTDARVNKVAEILFSKYPTPFDYIPLTVAQIGEEIFSTGFYNNKAKSIKSLCDILVNQYNGEVPSSIDLLVELPGVGRKTANVLLGNYFGIPGLVVDTHVTRISNLLKLSSSKNPVIIEKDLEKIVPKEDWIIFTHLIIDHGRAICIARRPQCFKCVISSYCPSNKLL